MSATNTTTYYGLSQYIGTDKPTYLGDYNADMLAIDTGIHDAAEDASDALTTANTAASTATTAATTASTALTTATEAQETAETAQETAETAATNSSAALVAAQAAEDAAEANPITNLAPAYDSTLTYEVGDLVTYDGKLYKCIVEVSTAMSFDLDYWDDVTTSATYQSKSAVVATTTSDGVYTYAEIFNSLFSQFTVDPSKKYVVNWYVESAETMYTAYSTIVTDHSIHFDRSEASASSLSNIAMIVSEDSKVYEAVITSSGLTVTNSSDTVVTSGFEFNIFESDF